MSQTDQLKAGQTVEINIGGKVLVIEPIPYGRLKKLFKLVMSAVELIGGTDPKNVMAAIPDLFEDNLSEFCELAFDKKKHEFLTKVWIEDNVTLLHIREIAESLIAVNGIKDFLGRAGVKQAPAQQAPLKVTEAS
jgi:hypothetical protein